MIDYKIKIRKLLALSESNNEHEAKSALLKAKALMAEHKLTEEEISNVKSRKVKELLTEITYSGRRDPWINALSHVISENYCCKAFNEKKYGLKTRTIGFIGLEDDIDICIAIFRYAVDCIHCGQHQFHEQLKNKRAHYRNALLNGYAKGYITSIYTAFQNQKKENEKGWGLIMTMPIEVKEACKNLISKKYKSVAMDMIDRHAYEQGLIDGKDFNPGKKIDVSKI